MKVGVPVYTTDDAVAGMTFDREHHTRGYWTDGVICRVRIGQTGLGPTVIISEHPDNENTSVTNLIEYLAAEIALANLPAELPGEPYQDIAWIEHYPARGTLSRPIKETWDRVTFSDYDIVQSRLGGVLRNKFSGPSWQRMSDEDVALLREVS